MTAVDLFRAPAAAAFDRDASNTPAIDQLCSASAWTVASHRAWGADADPLWWRGRHGHLALCRWQTDDGRTVLSSTDRMWRFGCPLVGADPALLVPEALSYLSADADWSVLAVSGIRRNTELWNTLLGSVTDDLDVRLSEPTTRLLIDLGGDASAWFDRRSRKFRAGLRRCLRLGEEAGVSVTAFHLDTTHAANGSPGRDEPIDVDQLLVRVLAIEATSWKAAEGTGLNAASMAEFYRELVGRLSSAQIRLWFATKDGIDVGYILGALSGTDSGTDAAPGAGEYRGLQQSFDHQYRDLGIGNILAHRQLVDLAAEGVASVDLGMPIDYKSRWADRDDLTETLVLLRS